MMSDGGITLNSTFLLQAHARLLALCVVQLRQPPKNFMRGGVEGVGVKNSRCTALTFVVARPALHRSAL